MTEKNNKKTIFGWSLYDWAKSAYETTTLGAILPVYFVSVVVPAEGFSFRGIFILELKSGVLQLGQHFLYFF